MTAIRAATSRAERPPASGEARAAVLPGGLAGSAFLALLLRDVRVIGKTLPTFLLRTIMQPLLFTFVFAYVFPKTSTGIGGARPGSGPGGLAFSTILVPGLVAVAVFFQGIQAVALPLAVEFSVSKEIEDRVLAPLPVWAVGVGKVTAGAVQAVLAAAVVFPVVLLVHAKGQAPSIHVDNWLTLFGVLLVGSLLSGAFGLLVGCAVDPRQIGLIFALIVLPATLLGCVYYPWSALQAIPWLQYATLVNPLVYLSEAFRAAFTPGVQHMSPYAFWAAMLGLLVIFLALGLRAFKRRVVS